MVDVWHDHPSCSAVAFRLRCTFEEAREGVILNNAMLAYDDGRSLVDDDGTGIIGTLIVCQACGRPVSTAFHGDRLIAITNVSPA
jgi:hypothetical protein